MINFIVYYGGRLFPKFLSFYFTAAHRFSKTHYYNIKIQSYNNTNGQFINCPYNLVGADSIRPQHQLPKRGNTTIPLGEIYLPISMVNQSPMTKSVIR